MKAPGPQARLLSAGQPTHRQEGCRSPRAILEQMHARREFDCMNDVAM